jgi:hypothetical protein
LADRGICEFSENGNCITILFNLPVAVASRERSLSKLKVLKNHFRPSMACDRLSNLSISFIQYYTPDNINYDDANKFAAVKARGVISINDTFINIRIYYIVFVSCYAATFQISHCSKK